MLAGRPARAVRPRIRRGRRAGSSSVTRRASAPSAAAAAGEVGPVRGGEEVLQQRRRRVGVLETGRRSGLRRRRRHDHVQRGARLLRADQQSGQVVQRGEVAHQQPDPGRARSPVRPRVVGLAPSAACRLAGQSDPTRDRGGAVDPRRVPDSRSPGPAVGPACCSRSRTRLEEPSTRRSSSPVAAQTASAASCCQVDVSVSRHPGGGPLPGHQLLRRRSSSAPSASSSPCTAGTTSRARRAASAKSQLRVHDHHVHVRSSQQAPDHRRARASDAPARSRGPDAADAEDPP